MTARLPVRDYVPPIVRERREWMVACPPCHLVLTFHSQDKMARFLAEHPDMCRQNGHDGNCDRDCRHAVAGTGFEPAFSGT